MPKLRDGRKTIAKTSNITIIDQNAFDELQKGNPNFALMSGFMDGEPTSFICMVLMEQAPGKERIYAIHPMFVAVTQSMLPRMRNHEGASPDPDRSGVAEVFGFLPWTI